MWVVLLLLRRFYGLLKIIFSPLKDTFFRFLERGIHKGENLFLAHAKR
mgnify:CR=1 FL=1